MLHESRTSHVLRVATPTIHTSSHTSPTLPPHLPHLIQLVRDAPRVPYIPRIRCRHLPWLPARQLRRSYVARCRPHHRHQRRAVIRQEAAGARPVRGECEPDVWMGCEQGVNWVWTRCGAGERMHGQMVGGRSEAGDKCGVWSSVWRVCMMMQDASASRTKCMHVTRMLYTHHPHCHIRCTYVYSSQLTQAGARTGPSAAAVTSA